MIITQETTQKTKTEKLLIDIQTSFTSITAITTKLRRESYRAQIMYEDAQTKLRNEVDVTKKVEEYRNRLVVNSKTLTQKYQTVYKIIMEIRKEITVLKERISTLTTQITGSTSRSQTARTTISTFSSKVTTMESTLKTLTGTDASKMSAEIAKVQK